MNTSPPILLLPGWQGSGPGHWQQQWAANGHTLVEQHDWQHPRRGDWIARLEEVLLATPEPAVLVAHSLGCHLVAAWAGHSQNTGRVRAALLVAPPDTETDELRTLLPGWSPVLSDPLPFVSAVVASTNDLYAPLDRAHAFARAWGSRFFMAGAHGHLNAESELGDWPQGQELLNKLIAQTQPAPPN